MIASSIQQQLFDILTAGLPLTLMTEHPPNAQRHLIHPAGGCIRSRPPYPFYSCNAFI